jgi:hypothetical protein
MTAPLVHEPRVNRARAARIEDELARRGHHFKRQGHELIGPCPVCGGTDRFGININKQVWNCRGCAKGGDVIAVVQHIEGSTFGVAVETLTGQKTVQNPNRFTRKPKPLKDNTARWLWSQRKPAAPDTPVAKYLRKRGCTGPIPPALAYLPPHGEHPPAMIAAFGFAIEVEPGVIIAPPHVTGVHVTKLTLDGDKADVENVKRTLGPSMGQPIVLSAVNDLLGLSITEGIEDGLTVLAATALGVWVAGSANRMPALAPVIPHWVECVTIYMHHDAAGRTSATQLAEALTVRGIEVLIDEGDHA